MDWSAAANVIVDIVQSLGFPIVMCGALFWKMDKSDTQHKEEQEKMADAVNNNTTALTRLLDVLSMKGDSNNGQT